jgi:ATP-dependent Clp endopeptidase proteolytic subunit ClpP
MYDLRAKSTKETDILMYGSISEWGRVNADGFVRALVNAKAQAYEKVTLRFHSPGGSIFEGLAIISQMRTQGLTIHGIVDGLAASMAGVILVSCDKCYMVKGTRLMIHAGSGGVMGQANQIRNYADLLDSLNKTLAEIFAKKAKKDAKWVLENWLAEGKDTWFTAEQALKEGLIDGIIDGKVQALPKEDAKLDLFEMAAHFEQYLNKDTNESKMNKEELIALLGLKADATEAEIQAALKAMKAKADAAPVTDKKEDAKKEDSKKEDSKQDDGASSKVIDGIVALAKERGADDKLIASIKKVAAVDIDAAMEMLPAKKDEATLSIAEIIAAAKGGSGGSENRTNWGFDDWEKKDPAGFAQMVSKTPEQYIKLYEARFGYKPTVAELQGMKS